jgi:hypothetical protein
MIHCGLDPDPWQRELLECDDPRVLVLCSRQAGKSRAAASLALLTALIEPPATVLIISRAMRQSVELFRKVKENYRALRFPAKRLQHFRPTPVKVLDQQDEQPLVLGAGEQIIQESVLQLELRNGSRIISLPGVPDTIVGYSAIDLLLIDEAARVPDELYRSVRPMLAVSQGRLVALSTPKGKRGWFYEENAKYERALALRQKPKWKRFRVNADSIPRIDPEFLEEEREALGKRWYRQEYLTSFEDVEDAVFRSEDISAAFSSDVMELELE